MDQTVETQPLDIESATDRAMDILYPEQAKPRDEKGRFASTQAEEVPAEPVEAAETPDVEPTQEGQEPAQEEPAEEISWDELKDVRVKVPMKADGKEWTEELTLDQLRAERMMQADYQRKTQEVAKQRAEAQEQARQAVQQAQARYAQELQALEAMMESLIAPELQSVDLNQLAEQDPATWARMFQKRQQIDQAKQAVKSKLEAQMEASRREMQERMQEVVREGMAKLTDPTSKLYVEALETKVPTIRKVAVESYDLTEQEVASITDPRFVKVLHDAMQWRELQSKKPELERRVSQAPKALKPSTRIDPRQQQSKTVQDLRAKLKRTGSIDDAVNYLMASRS